MNPKYYMPSGTSTLTFTSTSFNPVDDTVYRFTAVEVTAPATATSANRRAKIHKSFSSFVMYVHTSGTAGDNTAGEIRLRNHTKGTEVVLTNNFKLDAVNNESYSGVLECEVGDEIEPLFYSPIYPTTNPTNQKFMFHLQF